MGRSIVLLQSNAAVVARRKRLADTGSADAFGTQVVTERALLEELWALYGDGRRIASRIESECALLNAVSQEEGLRASTGMAALLGRLVRGGLGVPAFDGALAGAVSGLPDASRGLLAAVRLYEDALVAAGAVDPGRAWALLAASPEVVLAAGVSIDARDAEPSAALIAFASACNVTMLLPDEAPAVAPAAEGVQVRFAFPTGRYAEPALLVDALANMASGGRVAIAARDPFATYQRLAPALAQRGVACACRASVPFAQTCFGGAFSAVQSLVLSDGARAAAATDFLLNPFSGVSAQDAYRIDAEIRADRLTTRDTLLAKLRAASPHFEYFEELASSPEAYAVCGYFDDLAATLCPADRAFVSEQLAAIDVVRSAQLACCSLGLGARDCCAVVQDASVDVSRATGDTASVVIMSQAALAQCEPGTLSHVVLCDMTSDAYPLKDADDAATQLLASLGLPAAAPALARARRTFNGCIAAASQGVLIERCLNDADANPTYPAAVVEEFVNVYRADPSATDDIDNPYSLPEALQAGMLVRGEELLYANCCGIEAVQAFQQDQASDLGHASAENEGRVGLLRPDSDKLLLSASQIEAYLECPQLWFATRRLRLDELDEPFGPKEQGSFAHCALQCFYERFQQEVAPKVTLDTLPVAHGIMREVARGLLQTQHDLLAGEGRLVPVSALEHRQAWELVNSLVAYLDREVELLPGFTPRYFECKIPCEHPVDYAGHLLTGSIDRIDVDAQGRAVIIDYKGSLSLAHEYRASQRSGGELNHGKVQALVYAQAARRMLGVEPVGAIYVSYKRPAAAGVLGNAVEPSYVPGLSAEKCMYGDEAGPAFTDLLDETERQVEAALSRLLAGNIEPAPAHDCACTWCPEASCPERRK